MSKFTDVMFVEDHIIFTDDVNDVLSFEDIYTMYSSKYGPISEDMLFYTLESLLGPSGNNMWYYVKFRD